MSAGAVVNCPNLNSPSVIKFPSIIRFPVFVCGSEPSFIGAGRLGLN